MVTQTQAFNKVVVTIASLNSLRQTTACAIFIIIYGERYNLEIADPYVKWLWQLYGEKVKELKAKQ